MKEIYEMLDNRCNHSFSSSSGTYDFWSFWTFYNPFSVIMSTTVTASDTIPESMRRIQELYAQYRSSSSSSSALPLLCFAIMIYHFLPTDMNTMIEWAASTTLLREKQTLERLLQTQSNWMPVAQQVLDRLVLFQLEIFPFNVHCPSSLKAIGGIDSSTPFLTFFQTMSRDGPDKEEPVCFQQLYSYLQHNSIFQLYVHHLSTLTPCMIDNLLQIWNGHTPLYSCKNTVFSHTTAPPSSNSSSPYVSLPWYFICFTYGDEEKQYLSTDLSMEPPRKSNPFLLSLYLKKKKGIPNLETIPSLMKKTMESIDSWISLI